MSTPASYSIEAYKGDSYQQTFTFVEDGAPLDLTGAAVLMHVRKGATDPAPLVEFTDDPGGGITIQANALIFDKIVDEAVGSYIYDIQVTFPDATVKTYLKGSFKIIQDISR